MKEGDYKKYLDQEALPEALISQSPYAKKQRRV